MSAMIRKSIYAPVSVDQATVLAAAALDATQKVNDSQKILAGHSLNVNGLAVNDLLLFDGTAWVNFSKSTISDGGIF